MGKRRYWSRTVPPAARNRRGCRGHHLRSGPPERPSQRFGLNGRYLGEWANLDMVTTVAIRDGDLWIGTQQRNEPTGSTGWLMKIDRRSGKILGYVDSAHGHHVVNVTRDGDLLSGARPDTVLWFRRP